MIFETSKKIDEWTKNHKRICKTRAFDGGQFKYEFIPTGIVECQTVTCMCCDERYTDYID